LLAESDGQTDAVHYVVDVSARIAWDQFGTTRYARW